jgi:uncharacterized membrane protein
MEWFYPLHPLTVHFPVALLLANGLLTLLYLRGWGAAYEVSAYHCLVLGWFGAVVATLSGAWDAWQQVYGPAAARDVVMLNWVNAHAAIGLAIVGVYGRALLLRRRQPDVLSDGRARRGYLRLLLVGVVLVLLDGWLGGYLVYTLGLGTTR